MKEGSLIRSLSYWEKSFLIVTIQNIFPYDTDVIISIWPALLVPESNCVT